MKMRRAVIGISPDHCTEKELYKLNKAYTEAVNRAGDWRLSCHIQLMNI